MTTPTPETPAECIAPPGNLCTETGCWDADRCIVQRAPETPAGGLTTAEWLERTYRIHGHPDDWGVQVIYENVLAPHLADFVAAAVVQARAEDRTRIEAARLRPAPPKPAEHNFVSDFAAGWHMALAEVRAALTATEDGS